MIFRFLRLLPVIPAALLMACEEEASAPARGGWGGAAKVVTEQVERQHIVDEIEALGTTRANESIEILRKLWAEGSAEHEGPFSSFGKVKIEPKPILLKIAPDLTDGQLDDIIEIVKDTELAGIIATNTTIDRSGLKTSDSRIEDIGAGGLSGAPLNKRANDVIKYLRNAFGPEFPIIGVNTFLSSKGSPTIIPSEVIRATEEEKQFQIATLDNLHKAFDTEELLKDLQHRAINNQNIFESLMEVCKYCSLGEITNALFEVGGQYRRNM